jgi:hypothetical protein
MKKLRRALVSAFVIPIILVAADPIVADDDGSGPNGCKTGTCMTVLLVTLSSTILIP